MASRLRRTLDFTAVTIGPAVNVYLRGSRPAAIARPTMTATKTDVAVYRPSTGTGYELRSSTVGHGVIWGGAGDVAL